MEWISWTLAVAVLAQVGGTRIPPPETQLPATTTTGSPTVPAYPPNPGGPSLLPTTPPATTVAQPPVTGLAQPTTPPGLFPPTNAVPLQAQPASPSAVPSAPVITTQPPASTRAPIIATPPSGSVTLTSGEQAAPLAKVGARTPKADAAELLDTLMTLPEDLRVPGRPTTLIELLAPISDRQQQLAVAQSYWRTVGCVLELRLAHDAVHRLEQLQNLLTTQAQTRSRPAGGLEWQVRMSALRARRAEVELALVTSQHQLAERAGVNREGALPLPTDRPHAGSYRTLLDQIYGANAAPAQARLFDRQVPLRREAIGQQAAAVQAAHDATSAVIDALNGGHSQPYLLWSALDDLDRAQRSLVHSVRDYNLEIANYALNVPRGAITAQELVGMLITPLRGAVAPGVATSPTIMRPNTLMRDDNVAPATFEQPIAGTPRNEPTLAPPRGASPATNPANTQSTPNFGPRLAQRPVSGGMTESGLYQALVEQTPAKRAQDLAGLLHWDHALPEDVGQPLSLTDCLKGVAAEQRATVIDAYWQTREWAAKYHVLSEKLTQLDNLQIRVADRAAEPGASDAMLRLRTAQLLGKGELLAARTELSAAQMRLMQATGRATEATWIYGSTVPHGGRYQLRLEDLAENLADQVNVQRLATSIPALHRLLEERAGGIVLADAARVNETNRFADGGSLDELPLDTILRQADDSITFLETLTRYNREIASYVLTVLPAGSSVETLVQTLVVSDKPAQY